MPSWKDEKGVIPSISEEITPPTRHYPLHGKIALLPRLGYFLGRVIKHPARAMPGRS